jgi:hypothetical protein
LTGEQFENLVADLLEELDFKNVEKQAKLEAQHFDIKADYLRACFEINLKPLASGV